MRRLSNVSTGDDESSVATVPTSADRRGSAASASSSSDAPPYPTGVSTPPVALLNPMESLGSNLAQLLSARIGRPLTIGEHVGLQTEMGRTLRMLAGVGTGADAGGRQLLSANLLVALTHPSAVQLLASMTDALMHTSSTSDDLYDAVLQATISHATSIAAFDLAAAAGDGDDSSAGSE